MKNNWIKNNNKGTQNISDDLQRKMKSNKKL